MRAGEIEANLLHLQETFRLPYLDELLARKRTGQEQAILPEVDPAFHQQEYERLRRELADDSQQSALPEAPAGNAALNDLLVRLQLAHLE